MPKVTDTQLILLAAAASRDDGSILPLPRKTKLDRETADRVFKDLIKRKLVDERAAAGAAQIWRENDAGQPVALAITPAGLRAIGVEPSARPAGADTRVRQGEKRSTKEAHSPGQRRRARKSPRRKSQKERTVSSPAARTDTKQAKLIELLRRPKGTSTSEMVKVTGWQAHSVRGVLSGVLKKKLGLAIISAKEERGRVYRIAGSGK